MLLAELQKGYREHVTRALEHTAEFDALTLEQEARPAPAAPAKVSKSVTETKTLPLADVPSRYFGELERTKALAAETDGEKRDALALMSELTGAKPPEDMPKLATIMDEAEHDVLACMSFPKEHRAKLHSTNPIERLNGEIKRRTDVVGIFPNDEAIIRLVGALLLEQNDDWAVQHARYMTPETIAPMGDDPVISLPAVAS